MAEKIEPAIMEIRISKGESGEWDKNFLLCLIYSLKSIQSLILAMKIKKKIKKNTEILFYQTNYTYQVIADLFLMK